MHYPDIIYYPLVRNVSIQDVAQAINTTDTEILAILESFGVKSYQINFIDLSFQHLELLANAYEIGIKSYHSRISSKYERFNDHQQFNFRNFFSKFTPAKSYLSDFDFFLRDECTLLPEELDSELIKSHFYSLISTIAVQKIYGKNNFASFDFELVNVDVLKIAKHIILRQKKGSKNIDYRSLIRHFTISCHYYIFNDEEDSLVAVYLKISFSKLLFVSREALKSTYLLKFHRKWTMLHNLLKQLKIATYQIQISNYY